MNLDVNRITYAFQENRANVKIEVKKRTQSSLSILNKST